MVWIAPSEKDTANRTREKRLWEAADQFCANPGLKSQEYSWTPSCRRISKLPIQNLGRTRDLLLPCLLPGQVTF